MIHNGIEFRQAIDKSGNPYDGYYVSSDGLVGSTKRMGPEPKGHKRPPGKFHILSPYTTEHYLGMTFCCGGAIFPVQVHVLVACAWVGIPKDLSYQVNHKDAKKRHNEYSNLEWTTHQGNSDHAKLMGLTANGSRNGTAVVDEGDVKNMRLMHRYGWTQARLARLFKVKTSLVSRVILGRSWKHVEA